MHHAYSEMELTGEERITPRCARDVPGSHLTRRQQHHRRRSIRQPLRQVRHPHRQPEYGLDYATFLHHFKAPEIETIKVCQNARSDEGMQQSERKSSTSHCARRRTEPPADGDSSVIPTAAQKASGQRHQPAG